MASLSRRDFVAGSLCGCALGCTALPALGRVVPASLKPLVSAGYRPTDMDERGLWQACDRLEEQLAASNLSVGDPALKNYVSAITGRLLGDTISDLRVYVVRDSQFNASMMPTGAMVVQTGLLARMRNEAQLAAVLGHESGHYLRRHTVQNWRNIKTKSAVMAVVGLAGAAASGATGSNWYDFANAINSTLYLSLFSFSRELESEADAYGLKLLADARYSPQAASQVWSQLIDERKASAKARKKRYQDRSDSAFSTHPPTAERMGDLALSAGEVERSAGTAHDDGRAEWLAAMAPFRPMLLEEQIKLNDPGASLYLLNSLAQDGWDSTLRYYEGEVYRLRDEEGDGTRAADAYAAAVQLPEVFPDAWRAQGYALLKAGRAEEGRQALGRYLELRPDAADAAMVRFSLAQ